MKFLKILTLIVALALFSSAAIAQPGTMTVQGQLSTTGGIPLDGNFSLDFTIYDDANAGMAGWTESLNVPVMNSVFQVVIGTTTPIPQNLFRSGFDTYLEISVAGEPQLPRILLTTSPYVFTTSAFPEPPDDVLHQQTRDELFNVSNAITNAYANAVNPGDLASEINDIMIIGGFATNAINLAKQHIAHKFDEPLEVQTWQDMLDFALADGLAVLNQQRIELDQAILANDVPTLQQFDQDVLDNQLLEHANINLLTIGHTDSSPPDELDYIPWWLAGTLWTLLDKLIENIPNAGEIYKKVFGGAHGHLH